jgi:hypothetical protein
MAEDLEGSCRGVIEELSSNLARETEEDKEHSCSGFEPSLLQTAELCRSGPGHDVMSFH